MHFIAILAYQLPIPIAYNFPLVFISMAVAIVGSGVGFFIISRKQPLRALPLVVGSIFVGLGIWGLYLIAMASLRVAAVLFYDLKLMVLSVATAIGGSGSSLWLAFRPRFEGLLKEIARKFGSGNCMAIAIVGMHYLAMAGVNFQQSSQIREQASYAINNSRLAVIIGIGTALILILTILASFFSQRASAKRAEAEMQRRDEERFRTLVQNASDIIAIMAEDSTISYLSLSVNRILGYQPEEWLDRKASELIPADEQAKAKRFWLKIRRCAEVNLTKEFRLRHADGTWQDFEIIAKNLLTNFVVAGIVVTCRDVTERKRSEAQLQESKQQYQLLYDNAPDAYFSVTAKGTIKSANPISAKYLGYAQEELIGKPAWMTIYEPDRERFQEWFNQTFRQKQVENENEIRKIRKDGSYFWVRERSNLLLDEEETPKELHIICRDITERKQAEAALRESEAKFRSLIQNSSDLILLLDQNGTIQYASPSHERILGYEPTELIGSKAFQFIHSEDIENAQQAFNQLKQTASIPLSKEFRVRAKDGSWYFLESTGNNLLSDSSVGAVVVNSRNINERKQAEKQLFQNAFYDALTGLPNRILFMERLEHALEYGKRERDYLFAVLFLDLDRFKVINDSLGHTSGDQLLIAIARRLEACIRPTDTAARIGGDEFILLLEGIEEVSDAIRVAERIQTELRIPVELNGQEIVTGASIGIALNATSYSRAEDILRDADLAMYRAKELGKGRYEMFNTGMLARAVARLRLETELRQATERKEFRVYYQPIISLSTGNLIGFEALVRWQHPQQGLLSLKNLSQ